MIAVTIFGVGATIVHIMDIIATGNLAPGNTLQNVLNLLKPALLIWFLTMACREEAGPDTESNTPEFDSWRGPLGHAVGLVIACVASAFGIGFAINQPVMTTILGTLVGFAIVLVILRRSPSHQLKALGS